MRPGVLRVCGFVVALGSAGFGQVTQRISVASSGSEGNGYCLWAPVISADGRFVGFASESTNLVPADTNGLMDAFVRDRQLGITERVSVSTSGAEADQPCRATSISADGRYVLIASSATTLDPLDIGTFSDIFLRDRLSGTTEIVSRDSSGIQGDSDSYLGEISDDGRYVAFMSYASNLVPSDTNVFPDIFVRDLQTGTTERVNVDSSGNEANNGSENPRISADGQHVVFMSWANNLVPGDTNGKVDVFVHDRSSGLTERVSVDSSGTEGNGHSSSLDRPDVSADGRYVTFSSSATNLVAGDTNALPDIFVRDRTLGSTGRVSVDSAGVEGNFTSGYPAISNDGRFVAFFSGANNLVPGDTNGVDTFVRDRQSGTTERVTISSAGIEQDLMCNPYPMISGNGRFVVFQSLATNLVPWDTNSQDDIFVRDRTGGTSFTSLCDPGVGGVQTCPCGNAPSGSGRGCNNSASTGGAILAASGGTFLSSDSLVFTTSGEKPTATSVLLQGPSSPAAGIVYGQGIRCVAGMTKRLFTKSAVGGSITAPNFGAGDPTVSARSAAKGDLIGPGQTRWYLVFYRDPIVLGGCPATSTFNSTQTGRAVWSP